MGIISYFIIVFNEMKKLTSLLFFISKIQKKKISSDLEEKLMQKLKEKTLEKSWNYNSLSAQAKLSAHPRLARHSTLST